MVFRKRGIVRPNERFVYKGIVLDVVNDFNYLGTIFNYTGTFALNQEHLVGKALKSLNVLMANCYKFDLKPNTICQLFDSFVGSVLSYGSEIWGFGKSKAIERVHLKFCKRLLNVRQNSCNNAIYGELGRFPLFVMRYVNIVNYWLKIINSDNVIISKIYQMSLGDCYRGKTNWVSCIKKLLCDYEFSNVFDNPNMYNSKWTSSIFKSVVIDNFKQIWFNEVSASSVLQLYKTVKDCIGFETYLTILPKDLRFFVTRLRISAHSLRIQTDRYCTTYTPRIDRICKYCNKNEIEDEYHFVINCERYTNIRTKYLNPFYYVRPSMFKFISLLKSDDEHILFNLSKYIKEATHIRLSYDYITN